MGSQQSFQSSPRTCIVDRPNEFTAIKITEAVAKRLAAQSVPKLEQIAETPTKTLPVKQCQHCMQNDAHDRPREEFNCRSSVSTNSDPTKTVCDPKRNELEQEFSESVQNIEQYISNLKIVQNNFSDDFKLCQNIVIDCYKNNFDSPLNCSNEASLFKDCIVNLSFQKLNKN